MNIIIDPDQVNAFKEKYTVLELDTILIIPENRSVTAYCIVENIPLDEMPMLETNQKLHQSLMEKYRQKDWKFCQESIKTLSGKWGKELDSFYEDLNGRIDKYIKQDPGETWNGFIEKHSGN